MRRTLTAALVALAGCASVGPPPEAPATLSRAPAPPEPAAALEEPPEAPPAGERPLPPSIPIDASVTRTHPRTGEAVKVSLGGGRPVAWTRSEVGPDGRSFDPSGVTAAASSVFFQRPFRDAPEEVRARCSVTGLPPDALTLGLDSGASEVVWGDGTRGTVRAIHAQGPKGDGWSFDAVTTAPPDDSRIRSLTVALDLHRTPRRIRWEARIGVDEAATFEFEGSVKKWVLSADLRVTEFSVARYRGPDSPAMEWDPFKARLAGLTDAEGCPLQETGGSGTGSMSISGWSLGYQADLVPPVRVTVEAPRDTPAIRLVLRLEDLQPKR